MSKEGRLSRVGVLAPAALSACMDASVLAVPAASAIVSTVLKELSKAFMLKKWFHGNISAKEAEELMMERGKHGSFLVRESRGRPGDYVLTIRSKCRVSHVVIRKQNDKYDIGTGEEFDDLSGLIEHFRKFPIVETSGEMLRLLQPLGGLCIRRIESEGSDEETKRERAACMKIKREKWRKEFQILQFLDNIMYFTTSEAKKLENLLKNRYRDVRPYDQTRVILSKRTEHDSDYINANYIKNAHMFYSTFDGYRSSNESIISAQSLLERSEKAESELRVSKSLTENNTHDVKRSLPLENYDNTPITGNEVMYIATQGCLFETTNDFWRMIYQEDVRIIVMVARECERGKIKCARYWPDRKKKAYFDRFKVVCFSEKIHEEYLVRELEVYDEMNNCRTVYQYQYFAWPDHGAPMQVNGILGLIEDINACISSIMRCKNSPDKVILCVHCSAGIGRTGTFIALHMLIDKINNAGLDADLNVFETVKLIRSQRSGMVQSEDQYAFINYAVEEYVNIYEKKRGKKNKFLFLKD